jgi:hypothetical protein
LSATVATPRVSTLHSTGPAVCDRTGMIVPH